MFTLQKGDCEHCARSYHYALLSAVFGDFSYAYCDSCGALATIGFNNSMMLTMPKTEATHQAIIAEWEPFLRACICGGAFRRGAAPRCLYCNEPLSADYAASHIEKNTVGAPRGWHWQRNWTGTYCLAMEDSKSPGNLRQIVDPFLRGEGDNPRKKKWYQILGSD
jgi:hypothetical protein